MPPVPALALSAPAEAASVPLLRREVVGFLLDAQVCTDRTDDIRLAISEALSNAVLHAYRDREEPGDLEIRAECREGSVEVVVRDGGGGLYPRDDSPGLGLGLPLIAHMTDRYDVHRPDDAPGTVIRMCFDC